MGNLPGFCQNKRRTRTEFMDKYYLLSYVESPFKRILADGNLDWPICHFTVIATFTRVIINLRNFRQTVFIRSNVSKHIADHDHTYLLSVFMHVVLYKFCIYRYTCTCVSIIIKINTFIIESFLILNELLSFGCLWMPLVCIDRNTDTCFRWYSASRNSLLIQIFWKFNWYILGMRQVKML